MKYKIFGIETDHDVYKVDDKFECIDLDETLFYQSKEVFQHREDDVLNFDYKYYIEVIDWDACTGEEKGVYMVNFGIVPMFESLNDEKKSSVISCCGCEDTTPDVYDVHSYGCSVPLGNVEIEHHGMTYDECEELQTTLNGIANVFETIDRLRGFFLDRHVNRIGSTGWDLLNDYINGVNFVRATLDRYKTTD